MQLEDHVTLPLPAFDAPPHVAIIEARFYTGINDMLIDGVTDVLAACRATHEVFTIPGALEIPAALRMLANRTTGRRFDAFVTLGCVIRGATSHYETVCTESNRGITDTALAQNLAVGNGIITVENEEQAHERADKTRLDKGGAAARAAMIMLKLKQSCGV